MQLLAFRLFFIQVSQLYSKSKFEFGV